MASDADLLMLLMAVQDANLSRQQWLADLKDLSEDDLVKLSGLIRKQFQTEPDPEPSKSS